MEPLTVCVINSLTAVEGTILTELDKRFFVSDKSPSWDETEIVDDGLVLFPSEGVIEGKVFPCAGYGVIWEAQVVWKKLDVHFLVGKKPCFSVFTVCGKSLFLDITVREEGFVLAPCEGLIDNETLPVERDVFPCPEYVIWEASVASIRLDVLFIVGKESFVSLNPFCVLSM